MAERESTPDAAHDVLAAEAFAMPAPDPELHRHGPIQLPDDPGGVAEPHDILAAEEFPMPASYAPKGTALAERRGGLPRLASELTAGFVVLALVRRMLRRRR